MKMVCQECGTEFKGRRDAKYCSSDCRSTFHNRANYEYKRLQRTINKILWNNRQIMKSLNPDGKVNVSRTKLLESGFNFKYFTNEYETKSGNRYKFCYDYGYINSTNDYLTIVERQDYVE